MRLNNNLDNLLLTINDFSFFTGSIPQNASGIYIIWEGINSYGGFPLIFWISNTLYYISLLPNRNEFIITNLSNNGEMATFNISKDSNSVSLKICKLDASLNPYAFIQMRRAKQRRIITF